MKTVEVVAAIGLALAGCAASNDSSEASEEGLVTTNNAAAATPTNAQRAKLEQIAREYSTWRTAGMPGWANRMCRQPPPSAHRSETSADTPHGEKLFQLYARDRDAYLRHIDVPQPSGQVIVKETLHVVAVDPHLPIDEDELRRSGNTLAFKDNQRWIAGAPEELFVMLKGDESDPETDRGWMYATTSSDGRVVTSFGRVESCMSCHAKSPFDRVFGAPP